MKRVIAAAGIVALLTQAEVSATRIPHSGAWEIAAIVEGVRESRVFYGYTKREAIRRFVHVHKKGKRA